MKVINNCIIFNAEESAIITDLLNKEIHDHVRLLSSKKITDKATAEPEFKKECLVLVKEMRDYSDILAKVEESGWWPKGSVHKHHYFPKQFRNEVFSRLDNATILEYFIDLTNNREEKEDKK